LQNEQTGSDAYGQSEDINHAESLVFQQITVGDF
jgi:hypothetical protein